MSTRPREPVTLTGVPETLLWTLWYRAAEARRADTVSRPASRPARSWLIACSVLDPQWLDDVEAAAEGAPVLLTAEGLLMYLEPPTVHDLLARIAARLPGSALVLDAVPLWLSSRTQRGLTTPSGYRNPAMPWALDVPERRRLAALPGVALVEELPLPHGRGIFFGHLRPARAPRLPRAMQYLAPWHVLRMTFA